MNDAKIITAIRDAVMKALNEMGLEQFKKTSFFVSNIKKPKLKKLDETKE
jgi:hypothetical protein